MDTNIKPNSHKYREEQLKTTEERKVEKVVTGATKLKKKSEIRKFTDIFVSEDVANVKSYILYDVIIPGIKDIVFDIAIGSLKKAFWGESAPLSKKYSSGSSNVPKVSYGKCYDKAYDRRDLDASRNRNRFDYDDITFANRADAEAVLMGLDEIIDRYGVARVGDLYDLANVSTNNYMINRYGWTSINNASVARVSDGYIIKLPRPLALDN